MNTTILPSITDLADTYQLEEVARQADVLSPVSAEIMERVLDRNRLDLLNRARLLGFYYRYYWKRRAKFAKKFRDKRAEHILWFIENAPDCRFAGDRYFSVDKKGDAQNYLKVAAAWSKAIKRSKAINKACNSQVVINAALFFFRDEPEQSLKLVRSILEMDRNNRWAVEIEEMLAAAKSDARADDLLSTLQARPDDDTTNWREVCDGSYLHRAFRNGSRLSPVSVRTLEQILSQYPSDVTARAELMGFYGEHCERFNLLGRDPEYERFFAVNLLWFISHAPTARALQELAIPDLSERTRVQLQHAWQQQKQIHTGDSAVESNAVKFEERLRVKTDREKRDSARLMKQRGFVKNAPGALDEIAIKPDEIIFRGTPPAAAYSLTEWANNCAMDVADMSGDYGWVAPGSIDHLDQMLDESSIDFYSRAKLIGFYNETRRRGPHGDRLHAVFVKHLHWLISNVPDCEFLKEYNWQGLETDIELIAQTKRLWLQTARNNPTSGVYINAALAHFISDPARARSLVVSCLKLEPGNLMAEALLGKLDGRPTRSSSRQLLRKHKFVAGRKSNVISRASKRISITGAWLLGIRSPDRSVWTAEQVVYNNQNDLAMRAELLGFYFAHRYCFALSSRDPKLSAAHLPHQLWLIENTPETIGARVGGSYYLDAAGYRALVMAWKDQLEAYPNSASIAYVASWIFSGESRFFKEGIATIKRAIKLHPKDKRLKGRLKHLKLLAGIGPR